jgi:hypothetical protein
MARRYGVEELLPYSHKLKWVKDKKREEKGLRVKGTGVGEKVKGKEWERTVKGRLEKRRVAMLKMPEMIQQWKEVSNCLFSVYPMWNLNANYCAERSWSWMEEVAEMIACYILNLSIWFWFTTCCICVRVFGERSALEDCIALLAFLEQESRCLAIGLSGEV